MGGELAQNAAMIAVAIVAACIGVFKYLKTEAGKDKPPAGDTASVTAASFIDSRVLKELIDVLRSTSEEYSRETRKIARTRQELISALEETTDAVLSNTDSVINMVRFLKRYDGGRAPDNDM